MGHIIVDDNYKKKKTRDKYKNKLGTHICY